MELISREDAIKCLDGNVLITEQKEAEAVKEYFETVIARLEALPTIEERKEGEWMERKDILGFDTYPSTVYCCSQCYSSRRNKTKYCPNCGARMKGE